MNDLMFSISPLKPHERQAWLDETTTKVSERFKLKFLRGAVEHGGDIGNVCLSSLLTEIEAEALDQLSYVHEVRRRFHENDVAIVSLVKIIMGLQQGAIIASGDKLTTEELILKLNLRNYQYP